MARERPDDATRSAAEVLGRLLREQPPKRLLALGEDAVVLIRNANAALKPASVAIPELSEGPAAAPRWDMVVVARALEALPRSQGEALVARLRDLDAERLIIMLRTDSSRPSGCVGAKDLVALGLSRYARARGAEDESLELYQFDLGSYKRTPEWLNSKYWANPERFDKHRW